MDQRHFMKGASAAVRTAVIVLMLMAGAEAPMAKVVKILAIGNSFSEDAIEQNLHELAEADGQQTVVANMYIGGCSIERHVNNARKNLPEYRYREIGTDGVMHEKQGLTLKAALRDEQWDYVSVQQASHFSGMYDTYALLPELIAYIRKHTGKNTQLIFHQTWAYAQDASHDGFYHYGRSQRLMYDRIVDCSRKAVSDNGIPLLIPCGTAIQNMRTSFVGDNLNRDGYHLELTYGRYTAACTWYEAIFGRPVVGNGYAPKGLNPEIARMAQQAAHEAVRNPDRITSLAGGQCPVLTVSGGRIQGVNAAGGNTIVYRGIPYAAPPSAN